MSFEARGCQYFSAAFGDAIDTLECLLPAFEQGVPGKRISNSKHLANLLEVGDVIPPILAAIGAPGARPVRAILFDKRADQNWSLGWHQDRTICVKEKVEAVGFGPFSIKQGLVHVEPPFGLIDQMKTLRIHLDPVSRDNAPLLVAEGSHRMGRIPASKVNAVAQSLPAHVCLADRGDVWAYATPILHASERSTASGGRRVLQVDYSEDELPSPLEWLGIS